MNITGILKNTFTKVQCRNGMLGNLRALFNRQPIQHTRKYHQHEGPKQIQPKQTLFDVNNINIKKYPIKYGRALKIKLKIAELNYMYDPTFNVESFIKGANQALSAVTKSIHESARTEQYLSWPASKLIAAKSSQWNDITKIHIALEPSQILQTIVLDVNSISSLDIFGKIQYSIDVLGVGYRPFENSNDYIIETFLRTRFERDYGENAVDPQWKMVLFDLIIMNRIYLPI